MQRYNMQKREERELITIIPCPSSLASFKVPHPGCMVVVDHAANGVLACGTDHAGCGAASGGVYSASTILDFVEEIVVLALGQTILS